VEIKSAWLKPKKARRFKPNLNKPQTLTLYLTGAAKLCSNYFLKKGVHCGRL
jgi:hypothetical protein